MTKINKDTGKIEMKNVNSGSVVLEATGTFGSTKLQGL